MRKYSRALFQSNVLLGTAVLAIKLALYFLFIFPTLNQDGIYFRTVDFGELITPTDNFFEYNNYSLSANGEPFTGRLPGFIFPYAVFRAFMSPLNAVNSLGIFIVLFSIFVAVRLLKFLFTKSESLMVSYLAGMAILVVPFYWAWDWTVHPNSLAISCTILACIHLHAALDRLEAKHLLLCGFFLAWLFMLRGYTFMFLLIAAISILIVAFKRGLEFKQLFLKLSILVLSFIVVETSWVLRNALVVNKFIPLQTSFVPGASNKTYYDRGSATKESILHLRDLISCWGGNNFWYFKNADMNWFLYAQNKTAPEIQFPKIVFQSGITNVDLIQLKLLILESYHSDISEYESTRLENEIMTKSELLSQVFLSKKQWYYCIIAPLNRIRNFIVTNPTQDWPGEAFANNTVPQKGLKLLSIMCYLMVLFTWLLLFLLRKVQISIFNVSVFSFGLSLIVLFAFANTCHFSYFMTGYTSIAIATSLSVGTLLKNKSAN